MLYLITTTVFVGIALLTAALLYPVLTGKGVVAERLEKLAPKEVSRPDITPRENKWQEFFRQFGSAMPVSAESQSKYTRLLVAAGFRKESVYAFLGSKLLLAALLPALYVAYLFFHGLTHGALTETVLRTETLLIIVALAICGFLLPSYWLYRRVNSRQTEIFHTLPDILDLITVCVEAGLSMDAALIKASETPQFIHNPLASEIKIAAREARAGKPRIDALKDMAERTMVDDVKSFVTMLAQTERFGTSLSQALRVHSDSLRTRRRQIAEEAAAKTAIKLLFPLAFFVFPALLVVIIGPAFIQFGKLLK